MASNNNLRRTPILFGVLILLLATRLSAAPSFVLRDTPEAITLTRAEGAHQNLDPYRCVAGSHADILIKAINHSDFDLRSNRLAKAGTPNTINLSYRIYAPGLLANSSNPQAAPFEGPRFDWPEGVLAAHSESYPVLSIACPAQPGSYLVLIDVVQEGVSWRHDSWPQKHLSPKNLIIPLLSINEEATGASQAEAVEMPISQSARPPRLPFKNLLESDRAELLRAYDIAASELSRGLFSYYENGAFFRLANAGSQYPMVWSRDMASIARGLDALKIPTSFSPFHHWSELFLTRQDQSGVPDWFAPARRIDAEHLIGKNDILSDQELWTIISLGEAFQQGRLSQGFWWQESSLGRTNQELVIDALTSLLRRRWHRSEHCLMTGHQADWGDVGLSGTTEQTATKLGKGPRVCGLFSQGLLYQGLSILERILPPKADLALTDLEVFGGLAGLKAQLIAFAKNELWQPKKGFFRIHKHIDPLTHPFDEDDIFALGGHVLAFESDLADGDALRRAFAVYKQRASRISADGAVLLPSYPAGTFEHPIMDEAYEYQNGGIWDWYAPRLAVAVFEDDPNYAAKVLVSSAKRATSHGSFYEWHHLDQSPAAGPHYRASSASFIWAWHRLSGGELSRKSNTLPAVYRRL